MLIEGPNYQNIGVLGPKTHSGYSIWDLFGYLDPLGNREPSKQSGRQPRRPPMRATDRSLPVVKGLSASAVSGIQGKDTGYLGSV